LGLSLVFGIVLALLVVFLEKVSLFFAGGFLGFIAGFNLYNLFIYKLDSSGSNVWLWVTVVVCVIICAVLALVLHDTILILATAFGGAYLAVKLIGSMIGNYPDEMIIAQKIKSGEFDSMPWVFYLYLSIIVVFGIAGTIVQCKHKREQDKEDEAKQEAEYNKFI